MDWGPTTQTLGLVGEILLLGIGFRLLCSKALRTEIRWRPNSDLPTDYRNCKLISRKLDAIYKHVHAGA